MKSLILLLVSCLPLIISAQESFSSPIYSVRERKFINFKELTNQLAVRDMVIIGELHNREAHHLNQKLILEALAQQVTFNVGLEFVSWDKQMLFDEFQEGRIPRTQFIKDVWGKGNYSLDWYQPLFAAAKSSGGWGYGINAPKLLSFKVGKSGLESLTKLELTLMPPDFTLGSALYKERFALAMGGHQVPAAIVTRYFTAQSLWDESMAYNALGRSSQQLFVVIVGQFHIEYKLGLPARLKARDSELNLATVVQLEIEEGASIEEFISTAVESDEYGSIGDYILLTPTPDA